MSDSHPVIAGSASDKSRRKTGGGRPCRLVRRCDDPAPAGTAEAAYQWSTIVAAEHRGHRLGMLMKALNLQHLRRELPSVNFVNTWNAEENSYMVSVNEALGFTPMETWTEWGMTL